MKVYFSYQKSSDGITIYANYSNYLNSPFVKLNGSRLYVDTLERSYAEVKQDETKPLDIVLQFRQYSGDDVVGIQNVVVASF